MALLTSNRLTGVRRGFLTRESSQLLPVLTLPTDKASTVSSTCSIFQLDLRNIQVSSIQEERLALVVDLKRTKIK